MKWLNTKLLAKVFSWLVVAAVVWFFAQTLQRNWQKLSGVDITPNLWTVAAFLCFVIAVVVSGVLWGRLLNYLSRGQARISARDAVRIHCASWLLKYIPGQAGSFINKLAWGRKNGFTKKVITTSFIYENVLMVLAAVVLSLPVVVIFADKLPGSIANVLPYVVVLLAAVIMLPSVFRALLNTVTRLTRRDKFQKSDFLSGWSIVRFQLEYLLPRFINGVGFVLLAVSVLPIEPQAYLSLGAAYILAGIVGMLAIFVPGGIGVRESIIVLLASVYMPVEQAIVLSLVARFYTTLADIGIAVVYLSLNKWRINQL